MADGKSHPLDLVTLDIGSGTETISMEMDVDFDHLDAGLATDFDSTVASYKPLLDKPKIEGVTLVDDKSFEDLGLSEMSNMDLIQLYNSIVRS